MSQPVAASNYKRINGTGAGTTVIADQPANFDSLTVGANYTGTLTFYDTATAAGTTSTNQLIAFNNNSGSVPYTVHPRVATKVGLTVVVGGTTDALVGWSA